MQAGKANKDAQRQLEQGSKSAGDIKKLKKIKVDGDDFDINEETRDKKKNSLRKKI